MLSGPVLYKRWVPATPKSPKAYWKEVKHSKLAAYYVDIAKSMHQNAKCNVTVDQILGHIQYPHDGAYGALMSQQHCILADVVHWAMEDAIRLKFSTNKKKDLASASHMKPFFDGKKPELGPLVNCKEFTKAAVKYYWATHSCMPSLTESDKKVDLPFFSMPTNELKRGIV